LNFFVPVERLADHNVKVTVAIPQERDAPIPQVADRLLAALGLTAAL
jgi:hypothetical protein